MKRKLSPWCKEAKKALIDRDMTVTELSNEVGMCRNYVTTTLGKTGDAFCDVQTEHSGKAYLPESMRQLQAGDRVLIAWVQDTAVVIDIITRPRPV